MVAKQLVCNKWPKQCSLCRCMAAIRPHQGCHNCQASIICPPVSELLNEDQMRNRMKRLGSIRTAICDHQVALVLGAGVSKPSKMPMWSALISKMMGYAVEWELLQRYYCCKTGEDKRKIKNQLDLTRKLIKQKIYLLGGVNTLESAEYVAQFFDDPTAETWMREGLPEAAIRTMIERIIDSSLSPDELFNEDAPPGTGSLAERVETLGWNAVAKLNTMFAISYLLSAENGIHQAMTYNYDPLVQEHMMGIFGVNPDNIITHPGKWNPMAGSSDLREIYHVHGFVSGKRHKQTNLKNVYPDESGSLVLSEDSYYRIEQKEAYNWSSSIQSNFLNRYNCIFVGFSAEDYNFRRILRQRGDNMQDGADESKKDQPLHYLILTIDDWVRDTYKSVCSAYWDEYEKEKILPKPKQEEVAEATKCLLQHILDSREKYWKRFGIIPIWVSVEEIPSLLASLLTP